jgi:hypothetical protein
MDTEFHYWMTGIIAHRAGFNEEQAGTIAYCSEYVDENDVCMEIENKRDKKDRYYNYVSQTMNILKPKQELMRIYPIFHFAPGEPDAYGARRRDGKMHILNTTPNNEHANEVLDASFKAPHDIRLYRIGVATHTYVDTWAHQNFIGYFDYFNNIGLDPKPDIGHADAEAHPDWVGHRWTDMRLVHGDVNNNFRVLSAAEALFNKYCDYLGTADKQTKWKQLEKDLRMAMGKVSSGSKNYDKDKRISRYREMAPWLKDFDELKWFNEAVETDVIGLRDTNLGFTAFFTVFEDRYYWKDPGNRDQYHWYRFQEAVKEQEHLGISLLKDRFETMGKDIATL